MSTLVYNVFGSETSLDRDLMVVIDSPLNVKDSHDLVHNLDKIIAQKFTEDSKKLNTNICVVTNGNISWVFKGTPDECQNSIVVTYNLHYQHFPCIVDKIIPRNIPLKIARGVRSILSTMTRTEGNRVHVKSALKTDTIKARVDCLKSINIATLVFMPNCKEIPTELYKQIAFQMGQIMALISTDQVELYDKVAIGNTYPSLSHSLLRNEPTEDSIQSLQDFKIDMVNAINARLEDNPEWKSFGELLYLKNIVEN